MDIKQGSMDNKYGQNDTKSGNLASLHASAASNNAANKPTTHYSLRGTIESLEYKISDIITEISYHRQQL